MFGKRAKSKVMPVLYRTASPPAVYKADYLSLAFLVRCLCFLGTYLIPIIICIFFFFDNSQITTDTEFPIVHQGSILQFTIFCDDANGDLTINYPEDFNGKMVQSATPIFNQIGRVTSIIYKLSLTFNTQPTNIYGLQVLFNYSVMLQQYARGTTYGHGVFNYIAPDYLESISALGELQLEQSEAVDFRGELPGNEISKTIRHLTVESILNGQNNLSSLYYVKWNGVMPTFCAMDAAPSQFNAEFRVDIPALNIMHTLPLISVIESIIMCYLPTYILCSIIFGAIQKYCFGKGLVRVWRVKQYVD